MPAILFKSNTENKLRENFSLKPCQRKYLFFFSDKEFAVLRISCFPKHSGKSEVQIFVQP